MSLMDGAEFWSLKATHGLPLDFIVEDLDAAGVHPKWDEVLRAAKADGANVRKLVDHLKIIIAPLKDGAYRCAALDELGKRFA